MSDVANVKLGPCTVTWGATDLGYTKGGVEIELTTSKKKVMVDQFGDTEVNEYITGRTVLVRVPLAETDLDILASVLPGATLVTDGTTPTKKKININSSTGVSLRDLAASLKLHPFAQPASYTTEDVIIPLASPSGDISFAFRANEERIYAVEFVGYVENATGLLFILGDSTAAA
jgi:hypothetical protein